MLSSCGNKCTFTVLLLAFNSLSENCRQTFCPQFSVGFFQHMMLRSVFVYKKTGYHSHDNNFCKRVTGLLGKKLLVPFHDMTEKKRDIEKKRWRESKGRNNEAKYNSSRVKMIWKRKWEILKPLEREIQKHITERNVVEEKCLRLSCDIRKKVGHQETKRRGRREVESPIWQWYRPFISAGLRPRCWVRRSRVELGQSDWCSLASTHWEPIVLIHS